MVNTILGIKQDMGQAWVQDGTRFPTTMVKSGPNIVTQVKTQDKDGYHAVQLGFGTRKEKHTSKPLQGHFKGILKSKKQKAKMTFPRFLKEIKTDEAELHVGDVIQPVDVIKSGDLVQVTGVSKGKGFQGVVKRWGFAGGPKTHGQSDRQRAPGSIGQGTTPGRVYKGKKMAGRMGNDTKTIKNLIVLSVSTDGMIALSGPVPGSRRSLLMITKLGEKKDFEGDKG